MKINYACRSDEHAMARRQFLGTMTAAGAGMMCGGLGLFSNPALAEHLRSDQKRIVVFNMHGGLSQLESWNPKPGTDTGGPSLSIPTSVPGIHVSELLPRTAQQLMRERDAFDVTKEPPQDVERYGTHDFGRQPTSCSKLRKMRRFGQLSVFANFRNSWGDARCGDGDQELLRSVFLLSASSINNRPASRAKSTRVNSLLPVQSS